MKALSILAILIASLVTQNIQARMVEPINSADIVLVKKSQQTDLLDLKFESFQNGRIEFSRAIIRLLLPPVEITFSIKRFSRTACEDIYYGVVSDTTKSTVYEEIKFVNPNTGRCAYIQEPLGEVIYRISGSQINWAQFVLKSNRLPLQ